MSNSTMIGAIAVSTIDSNILNNFLFVSICITTGIIVKRLQLDFIFGFLIFFVNASTTFGLVNAISAYSVLLAFVTAVIITAVLTLPIESYRQIMRFFYQPTPTIKVQIDTNTVLKYHSEILGTNGGQDQHLHLVEPFVFELNNKLRVKIGSVEYDIVKNGAYGPSTPFMKKLVLPIGTHVKMSNGITVPIAEPLEVDLPIGSEITLYSGTKIYLPDTRILVILDGDCPATLQNPEH